MMDGVPMLAIISALLLVTWSGGAQSAPPVNDRANPYAPVRNWPQLPEGRTLGAVSGVDVDRDGSSIWIADRCGGSTCADSTIAPVLKFDGQGRLCASNFKPAAFGVRASSASASNGASRRVRK